MSGNRAPLIQAVVQAARTTFARKAFQSIHTSEDFKKHLIELRSLASLVKATDLGLERSRILSGRIDTERPQIG